MMQGVPSKRLENIRALGRSYCLERNVTENGNDAINKGEERLLLGAAYGLGLQGLGPIRGWTFLALGNCGPEANL